MPNKSFSSYLGDNKVSSQFWNEFKSALAYRLKKPLSYPQFVLYFASITVLVGLTGVFFTLVNELKSCSFNHDNLALSIATFFVALLSSASADLIMAATNEEDKTMRIVGITALVSGIGLFWLTSQLPTKWNYAPAVLGLLLSVTLWWIANADNPNLTLPPLNPDDSVPSPGDLAGNPDEFNA